MTGGAVLLTYRPLAERDAAAEVGARLAARFGGRRLVFASHLRPERFAANRALVALLGRGDNTAEVNRWLSDLRGAVQAGVPVALVLVDGAAQPPAQNLPNDPNAANAVVVALSTADFDRDVAKLIAILTPLVGADDADWVAEPAPSTGARAMSIEEPSVAARAGRSAGEAAASFGDPDLPEMLDDEPPDLGPNDAELESLAQNRFAPRIAPPAGATALESAPSPPPPPPAVAPAAEPSRSASDRAAPWTPPLMRPPAAARMPDSAPWPAAILPTNRGFATAPIAASSLAAPQPRSPPDPRPTEGSRSRSGVWGAALGLAVVVAGVGFAYVFRNEIAALIDPIASNLLHRATPPAS